MKAFKVLLLFLISILLVSSVSASKTDLQVNNTLYLSGDDSNQNYTITGTPVGIAGVIDGAIDFDGTGDYISVPDATIFDLSNAGTINAWVGNDGQGSAINIMNKVNAGTNGWMMYYDETNYIYNIFLYGSFGSKSVASTTTFNGDTTYHMVTGAWDGTNLKIYIDGSLEATTAASGTVTANTNDVVIGKYSANYFDGRIDDVRIYDGALNTTEITSLYNSGSGTENESLADETLVFHDTMNELYDYTVNANHATATGGVGINTGGKFNSAYSFDGTDDYLTLPSFDATQSISVNAWVKKDTNSGGTIYQPIIGGNTDMFHFQYNLNDKLQVYMYNIGNSNLNANTTISDFNYHMTTFTYDGVNIKVYLDGVLDGLLSATGDISSGALMIGRVYDGSSRQFDGLIDEVSIWNNKILTQTEISEMYNLTSNIYVSDASPYFEITAQDNASASINSFNATINGTTYNTTNGTVTTTLLTADAGVFNISIVSSGYYDYTNSNYNTSSNLLADLITVTYFDLNATNLFNTSLNTFNTTINGTFYSTTNGTIVTDIRQSPAYNFTFTVNVPTYYSKTFTRNTSVDYIATGFYQAIVNVYTNNIILNTTLAYDNATDDLNITTLTSGSNVSTFNTLAGNRTYNIKKSGYYDLNQTFEITSLTNTSVTVLNLYSGVLNVTAYSLVSLTGINNFTINLTHFNSSSTQTNTTTNGISYFRLLKDYNYNITIDASGYEIKSLNATLNTTNSVNISLYTTNSLSITFKDSDTKVLLNGTNISIQFIGLSAQTLNTINGSLYVDLLSPDDYTFLYEDTADAYQTGKYLINVATRTYQNLTLYLQKKNNSELILLTVTDKFGTELQDVEITIQKWSGDAWITDQIVETDFQGQTEAYYVLSTVYYNHVLELDGTVYSGAINDDANKKLIFAEDVSNGINFKIDILGGGDLIPYLKIRQLLYNLTWNGSITGYLAGHHTGLYRFAWNDIDNSERTGCLNVHYANQSLACSSCSTTSTGTVLCYVSIVNGTRQTFSAYATIDEQVIDSSINTLGTNTSIDWGVTGYVVAFIITLLTFIIFLNSPSISLLMGTAAFISLSLLGLIFQDFNYAIFITLMAITFLIARIKSDSGVNG